MGIKIIIVDDHGVLRAGLRALLNNEEEMEVVGEAGSSEEAVRLILNLKPDIVLMDISLGGESGIEVTKLISARKDAPRVLMLTIHEDETLLQSAIQAGASGYILKRAVEVELINAIRAVARGEMYIHPAMTRLLFEAVKPEATGNETITLTSREVEVLKLIVRGHTNRQIAEVLSLSVRTVESHRANIMSKLNLRSRVELVRYAAANGLLEVKN